MKRCSLSLLLILAVVVPAADDKAPPLNTPPKGFTALFNGKDLENWHICIPIVERNKLKAKGDDAYKNAIEAANKKHLSHWTIKDGVLHYDGKGFSLQTAKDFGDIELFLDWKIATKGDSGLYLRGQPQVQIWDSDNASGARGKDKSSGSGALWNNPEDKGKRPLVKGDNPVGEWNTFHIVMKGDLVTVKLNGKLVLDKQPLLNFFQRGMPLPAAGPIELQHHGDPLWFRNIYIRELKADESK